MRAFIPLRSVLLLTALGASGLVAQPAATPGFTEPEITAAFLTHLIGFGLYRQQAKPSALSKMTRLFRLWKAF